MARENEVMRGPSWECWWLKAKVVTLGDVIGLAGVSAPFGIMLRHWALRWAPGR